MNYTESATSDTPTTPNGLPDFKPSSEHHADRWEEEQVFERTAKEELEAQLEPIPLKRAA